MRSISLLIIVLGLPTAAFADDAKRLAFFEKQIRPVLVQHCYKCHSTKSKPLRGGLLLDSRAASLRGGESGPAIVPGKPADSLLISALKHDAFEMPPAGKLPAAVIANFERWIKEGAVDPRGGEATAPAGINWSKARRFWSFRPISRPQPPAIARDAGWTRGPIDRFILARLTAQGLQPSAPADRPTLLRRATFDLTGLPPTRRAIDDFLADRSPNAFAKVIDRLLASPQYGERWGRHWLDVARYADSNGSDENLNLPNAWRYRDYVISSFNADLPYDRFVREQLAGDLLSPRNVQDKYRLWTATGFLVLGSKMLAEQDKAKMLADVVDEQIDTLSQSFLGLTIGCARCHDHKFDPIPTADYYALAGILHSTKSMANREFVSKWNERYLADPSALKTLAADKKKLEQLKKRVKALRDKLNSNSTKSDNRSGLQKQKKTLDDRIKKLTDRQQSRYPSTMAVEEGKPRNVPIHIRGSHLKLASQPISRGFLSVTASLVPPPPIANNVSGRLQLANWLTAPQHPLTSRVIVNRVWQGHFGRGLVDSPNNFGLQGATPTHPRLLDWLASELMRNGWSIKQLHRQIMLSATYRMGSRWDQASAAKDPENRWLWRQNRHRLEVEPIRDAILAVGGSLDLRMGGSISKDDTPNYQRLKKDVFDAPRRAVYLPINRSALFEMFSIFDYADASAPMGRRSVTTVSHQALFMLNNPLVLRQSAKLAQRITAESTIAERRLENLYLTLYGRAPNEAELLSARRYLQQAARLVKADSQSLAAWTSLCRILIAANEFIYVN